MKKTIIASITAVTLTIGALSGAVYADGKGGPKSAEDRVEKLTQRLDLSVVQQYQLLAMFTKRDADRGQMQATLSAEQRENMKANARDGMRDQMHKESLLPNVLATPGDNPLVWPLWVSFMGFPLTTGKSIVSMLIRSRWARIQSASPSYFLTSKGASIRSR